MKAFLLLALTGILGYLIYEWWAKQHATPGTAASQMPQSWPAFPTVAAPPAQFANTLQGGPWPTVTGDVSPSYGIQP